MGPPSGTVPSKGPSDGGSNGGSNGGEAGDEGGEGVKAQEEPWIPGIQPKGYVDGRGGRY